MTICATDDPQVIDVSGGAAEYTWPEVFTELTGKDISGDTVVIAVGSQNTATTFSAYVTPDIIVEGTISAKEFMLANPSVPGVKVPTGQDPATFLLHWVSAQVLIGAVTVNHAAISPTPGDCYPYLKITDSPETVPRRGSKIKIT